jgi:hypothetical protein
MSETPAAAASRLDRIQRGVFIVAGVAVLVCALGAFLDLTGLLRSYLFAWFFCLAFALGGLPILMLHQLTGGRWGTVLQPVLRPALETLPLLAVLFVPVLAGLPLLYPWADADHVAHVPLLQKKAAYLNMPFFVVRTVIYFAIWITLAWLLARWSRQPQADLSPGLNARAGKLSGPGLVLYGLTITFASIDWIMSLEPEWFSSIFGVLIAVSMCLPAFALGIVVLAWREQSTATQPMEADTWNDLGNLLLMFVMLWAYMSFSQYFLIWSGNLPEEIVWFLHRTRGPWRLIAVIMVVFYFFVPFFLLLSRAMKRDPRRLSTIAAGIIVIHLIHSYWLIKPSFLTHEPTNGQSTYYGFDWWDPFPLLAIGGLWGGVFLYFWKREEQTYPIATPAEESAHEREQTQPGTETGTST